MLVDECNSETKDRQNQKIIMLGQQTYWRARAQVCGKVVAVGDDVAHTVAEALEKLLVVTVRRIVQEDRLRAPPPYRDIDASRSRRFCAFVVRSEC